MIKDFADKSIEELTIPQILEWAEEMDKKADKLKLECEIKDSLLSHSLLLDLTKISLHRIKTGLYDILEDYRCLDKMWEIQMKNHSDSLKPLDQKIVVTPYKGDCE